MGREANCDCTWPGGSGPVRALLETQALILRGALQRRIPIAMISGFDVSGDDLRLATADGTIALHLGAKQAASWATKLQAPPPSLRAKLGLAAGAKAFVVGQTQAAELVAALAEARAATPIEAAMTIAIVTRPDDLDMALHAHAGLPRAAPIWIVHAKGKGAEPGETVVRAHLRAAGYIDTKVTAVSDRLSATRFARAKRMIGSS